MKKALLFALITFGLTDSYAQVEILKAYNGAVNLPADASYPAETALYTHPLPAPGADSMAEAGDRRTLAIAKVRGSQSRMLSARGLRPAEYASSGESIVPVEYSVTPIPSTTMTLNGQTVQRSVVKGLGQVGDDIFTPISELHFVQFAVYCKNTPVDKAPSVQGLFLIWHDGSKCPGDEPGAVYIVKGFTTVDEAKTAVLEYKAAGIDCWYNPSLSGAEVEIIGVR